MIPPRIDWKFDIRGLSLKIRQAYGVLLRPESVYEVYNSAQDPDGVYYWKFVNDGTGPKVVDSAPFMVFTIDGELVKKTTVGGNPPVLMLEDAMLDVRPFFKEQIRQIKFPTKENLDTAFRLTAEFLKEKLEELTPEIDDKYIDSHPQYGTPEPGLLKESYGIREV